MTNYDEYDTYWQNGGYKKISDIIFAEWHVFIFLIFDSMTFHVRHRTLAIYDKNAALDNNCFLVEIRKVVLMREEPNFYSL